MDALVSKTDNDLPLRPAGRRYASKLSLPSYAFIPGKAPHPIKDPKGHFYHRHDQLEELASALYPEEWRKHLGYLYGVDLFNHRYWWEAHEIWEGVWRASLEDDVRNFLQGMIQIAAALLNAHLGTERHLSVINLSESIAFRLNSVPEEYCGVRVQKLLESFNEFIKPFYQSKSGLDITKAPRITLTA
jgi:predicted metal-dependent hydrolase